MRLIGTLPAAADARRFVDYLLTRRIAAHAEEGQAGDWQVWIEHDDQLDAGRAELDRFRANPADAAFDSAADAAAVRKQEQKAAERRRRNFRDVRTSTFGPAKFATPVAVTLIFVTVVLAGLMRFGEAGDSKLLRLLLFSDRPPKMLAAVRHGELWRLVTPIFIHFGVLHLVFNMSWLWRFGQDIEAVKGGLKFLALVLTIAVLSNSAEGLWTAYGPAGHGFSFFGGMSGVNAGLFGYAWMVGRCRPYERIRVSEYETGLMLGWLVICSLGVVGPIANAAHWGGLAVGVLIGAGPTWWKKMTK